MWRRQKKEKKILKQTRKRCVSVGIFPCCQMIKTFPFKHQTARDIFSSTVGQQIPEECKESQTKGHVENYSKQHSMLIHFTQMIWRMYLNRSLSEAPSSSFLRRLTFPFWSDDASRAPWSGSGTAQTDPARSSEGF